MNTEKVITDLQIIHTWASFASERDINFFNEKHMKDLMEWTDDAIALIKQQENIIKQYRRADGFLAAHGWKWENGE